MEQPNNPVDHEVEDEEVQARRDFLKKAGKLAVAAPALALILKAEKTHAWGRDMYGGSSRDYDLSHVRRSGSGRGHGRRRRRHHRHHR